MSQLKSLDQMTADEHKTMVDVKQMKADHAALSEKIAQLKNEAAIDLAGLGAIAASINNRLTASIAELAKDSGGTQEPPK